MPLSDAQKRANANYRKKSRKQIILDMSIEDFNLIDEYCKANNFQKATFIKQIIREKIESNK